MKSLNKSARAFTASLKPAWTNEQMSNLAGSLTGSAYVYCITHDKDVNNETGELIEPHTHIVIDYQTPRKISTVANILGVESNFIEIVKSKNAILRYLTHLDDPDKYQYQPEEVTHNNSVTYEDLIRGQNLSDKEIADYIRSGRGQDLLGIISSSKLRTIQAFLQYDRQGQVHQELQKMNENMTKMTKVLTNIDNIVSDFQNGIVVGAKAMVGPLELIANELKQARSLMIKRK